MSPVRAALVASLHGGGAVVHPQFADEPALLGTPLSAREVASLEAARRGSRTYYGRCVPCAFEAVLGFDPRRQPFPHCPRCQARLTVYACSPPALTVQEGAGVPAGGGDAAPAPSPSKEAT
jgi:hypothetical protein